jgi:hypothetical protein
VAPPDGPLRPDLSFRLRAFPAAVFADLIRDAGEPMRAQAVKRLLESMGFGKADVDAAWKRAQPSLRRHTYVDFDAATGKYGWRDGGAGPKLSAEAALDRLVTQRLTAMGRIELAELVRAALHERDELEARARGAYLEAVRTRSAEERQIRVDAARALAEVAMEVEELAAAGSHPLVTVERVRTLAAGFGLAPIGRAGEESVFDPAWHAPIGAPVLAGTVVKVIRPGYTWRANEQDVLIAKAHVAPV